MNASNELTSMFDKLVTEKTFSMDALEGIQALKRQAAQLEKQNEKLQEDLEVQRKHAATQSTRAIAAEQELKTWRDLEQSLMARELKVFENEKKAAVAEAVSNAYLTSMKIVFAPNTVRESVQKYGMVNGGNGMSVPTNDSGTVLRADGYSHPGDAPLPHGGIQTNL
jgi:hypothetical protein